MSWITALARPEILSLKPYAHAAWEAGLTRLHANELPWRAAGDESLLGLHRYPEPQARAVLERLAELYGVPPEQLLICRGSDEAIDLLTRTFCRAHQDAVLVCPPTFGMYATAALIQGAPIISVALLAEQGFELDSQKLLSHYCLSQVKLVFLCSPNNPTGNLLREEAILTVADELEGRAILVVDEAYIEFSNRASLAPHITRRPHLAVLRTLSKAHGLAGARLGTLIANPEVIALVRKLIAPYAVPQVILETVTALLSAQHLRTIPEAHGPDPRRTRPASPGAGGAAQGGRSSAERGEFSSGSLRRLRGCARAGSRGGAPGARCARLLRSRGRAAHHGRNP